MAMYQDIFVDDVTAPTDSASRTINSRCAQHEQARDEPPKAMISCLGAQP
jgi:hypothetical protein